MIMNVASIREEFVDRLACKQFVRDKSGVKTIEIVGAHFMADEESIFGPVNYEYIQRELEWYASGSLNVNDIPPPIPSIWKQVASETGQINSNYGWCIDSFANHFQYRSALNALLADSTTRRAIMIYTRPSMQVDYIRDGMSDFMCTNTVQYLLRNGSLNAIVSMRSNDVVFGYRNDRAYQNVVLHRLVDDYNTLNGVWTIDRTKIRPGSIIWDVGSLHVYERHFDLIKPKFEETL